MKDPKLKTVKKIKPPFALNSFPDAFAHSVGLELVFMLATSRSPSLEGAEWERIFAKAIDAEWKPSNVGLDDIIKGPFAWGAKTVKNLHPHDVSKIRLISGRNNPEYSFEVIADTDDGIGAQVLEIWNGRVDGLRDKFSELRTVVLIKPNTFTTDKIPFSVFEFETLRYPVDRYNWKKNKRGNLEGFDNKTREHKFTWQRHGSQFTVVENIPEERLRFFVKKPPSLAEEDVLKMIGYDQSWVEVI